MKPKTSLVSLWKFVSTKTTVVVEIFLYRFYYCLAIDPKDLKKLCWNKSRFSWLFRSLRPHKQKLRSTMLSKTVVRYASIQHRHAQFSPTIKSPEIIYKLFYKYVWIYKYLIYLSMNNFVQLKRLMFSLIKSYIAGVYKNINRIILI